MDYIEILKIILPLFALAVSIITIVITRKNLKKQLRLGKLEEILEILHYLNGYYSSMFGVFNRIENSMESLSKSNEITDEVKEMVKYRNGFISQIDKKTITDKISRLIVLSNAYLDNSKKLKIKIHNIGETFYHMYMFIALEGDSTLIRKEENAVIPSPNGMRNFINKIESKIIKEMNLGYKNVDGKAKLKYYNTEFKNDVGGI